MKVNNFLNAVRKKVNAPHDGVGVTAGSRLFTKTDFETNIVEINASNLPPGTSIGEHTHGNDEEIYIILKGNGKIIADGETREAITGDIFVNERYGTHEFINNTDTDTLILTLKVDG